MTQLSAPDQGELLAGRYRLDDCISEPDDLGKSLWRGTDEMLNRTVAIEVQVPGGDAADALIDAAVTAGRISHPNVAGVYDAVNSPTQAFVVREWVDGSSLTAVLTADGPMHPGRAATLIRGVADGVAAVHANEHAHGALTPDNVLVRSAGEVSLTGLRLSPDASYEADMRAIGGLLYAALTAHWPAELGQHPTLPDAVRVDGVLCSPSQVRAGIPGYLDALAIDLLDPSVAAPEAAEFAAELRRYDVTDPELSALTALDPEPPPFRPMWKRMVVPIAAVACIAAAGMLIGTRGLPHFSDDNYPISDDPTKRSNQANIGPLPLVSAQIMDPEGDGSELDGADRTIDKDDETSWITDAYYNQPEFGGIKSGMGVVVDLGEVRDVREVTAKLTEDGARVELRAALESAGDPSGFTPVGEIATNADRTVTFKLDKPAQARYVLLWITRLPQSGQGSYSLGVSEISVVG